MASLVVVLCRVGKHRLAFPAADVASIESFGPARPFPQARQAFALPASPIGRLLSGDAGTGVVVDDIDVQQDALPLLPSPRLMRDAVGGSLSGFAHLQNELWPVFKLEPFSRFLQQLGPQG